MEVETVAMAMAVAAMAVAMEVEATEGGVTAAAVTVANKAVDRSPGNLFHTRTMLPGLRRKDSQ